MVLLSDELGTEAPYVEESYRRLYSCLMRPIPTDASGHSVLSQQDSAPPDLVAQAASLIKTYPECFWFWHPEAQIRSVGDVRLVVKHLREYGDRRAWLAAQDLYRCLLPLFKKTF